MAIIFVVALILILGFIIFRFGRMQKNRDNEGTLYIREDRGEEFENHADCNLDNFETVGGKLLKGVVFPTDEVLILKSGIYVVDFKDCKGRISGSDTDDIWTAFYQGGRPRDSETQFYNPVKQNQKNIKHITSLLPGLKAPVQSIVVFSNECSLKNITNTSDAYIIKEGILIETIIKLDQAFGSVLSAEQIENIYRTLDKAK